MFSNLLILINLINILVPCDGFDCDVAPTNSESRIKKKILCDYDKESPPPSLATNKKGILIEVRPKVFNVYQYSNGFHISTRIVLFYTDERLIWDKADFDHKESLLINGTDIWLPSISQINIREEKDDISEIKCSERKCDIHASGSVTCVLPCEHYSHCALSYYNWPYVFGNCSLLLGYNDETHQGVSFNATQSKELNLLTTNREFVLVSAVCGTINENKNDKIKNHIKCVYKVIRHTAAEIAEILTPLLINSFVCILVLLIDVRKAERLLLSAICMLLQVYITGIISYEMVNFRDENLPKLAIIMSKTTLLAGLTIFETITIRSMLAFTYEVPYWMKIFLSKVKKNPLTELLFIKSYIISEVRKKSEANGINTATDKIQNNSTNWENLAKIIDRVLSFVLIGLYAILWYKFGPSSKLVEQFRIESQSIPE